MENNVTDILLTTPYFPFTAALLIMLVLAAIEIVSFMLGGPFSSLIDNFLPDFDVDVDLDADLDTDMDTAGGLSGLMIWLKADQVPFLIILLVFLSAFSALGIGLQSLVSSAAGEPLSSIVASVLVLPATLPVMRFALKGIAKILPSDETDALGLDSLVGSKGTILTGVATRGSAAQAKVKNAKGDWIYVMVEPEDDHDQLESGSTIEICAQHNSIFLAKNISNLRLGNES